MDRHPHFDLWLHDDAELAALLGSAIVERRTLHEWPLSCVQQLTTADGRTRIYKAQRGPTVEPAFYARARSDLLVPAEAVYAAGEYVCMVLDYVDAPALTSLSLGEAEAVQIGRDIAARIARIAGEPPVFLDIGDGATWAALISATLADLHGLIDQGRFTLVDRETVRDLQRWAFAPPVRAAWADPPTLAHGDLTGDNVFVLPGGYRVIDWQRPVRGPAGLDLATLLSAFGYDPLPHMGVGVVQVMRFLHIHHLARCAVRWFPEGAPTYDQQTAALAALIGAVSD